MSILDTFLGGHFGSSRKERERHHEQVAKKPPVTEMNSKEEITRIAKEIIETTKEKSKVSMKAETEDLRIEIEKLVQQTEALTHAVDENKEAIIEKVHIENVKAFKNVQAILNELDEKMAKAEIQNKQMESLKIFVRCGTWFSIMNLLVLVLYILYTQGVF